MTQGCNTTGSNLEQSVQDLIDLSPGLIEHEYAFYINMERNAVYDEENNIWKGTWNKKMPKPEFISNFENQTLPKQDNVKVETKKQITNDE